MLEQMIEKMNNPAKNNRSCTKNSGFAETKNVANEAPERNEKDGQMKVKRKRHVLQKPIGLKAILATKVEENVMDCIKFKRMDKSMKIENL